MDIIQYLLSIIQYLHSDIPEVRRRLNILLSYRFPLFRFGSVKYYLLFVSKFFKKP